MRKKDNIHKIIVVTFVMIISATAYALSTEKAQTNISK